MSVGTNPDGKHRGPVHPNGEPKHKLNLEKDNRIGDREKASGDVSVGISDENGVGNTDVLEVGPHTTEADPIVTIHKYISTLISGATGSVILLGRDVDIDTIHNEEDGSRNSIINSMDGETKTCVNNDRDTNRGGLTVELIPNVGNTVAMVGNHITRPTF